MKDKMIVAMVGIVSIAMIETACIIRGIDGAIAIAVVGVIASIVGYAFGHFGTKKE